MMMLFDPEAYPLTPGAAGPVLAVGEERRPLKLRTAQREQSWMIPVIVDKLVDEDHEVRAIWEYVGQMELGRLYAGIKTSQGASGRAAIDPRTLAAVWMYGLSKGVNSARELERRCQWEPAYQWLTGMRGVNYHPLSDFRTDNEAWLAEAFVEVVGLLRQAGLVTLERVMIDGTKVRANAGGDSYRSEETLERHLTEARQHWQEVLAVGPEENERRLQRRRERAAAERVAQLEQARQELAKRRQSAHSREDAAKMRVSETDPDSRVMKSGDGGYRPSYNVQVATDEQAGVIVGVRTVQSASDAAELVPDLEAVRAQAGQLPAQTVVDGGFTNRPSVVAVTALGVDLIGSMTDGAARGERELEKRKVGREFWPDRFVYDQEKDAYRCPCEKTVKYRSTEIRDEATRKKYEASASDCQACGHRQECCPGAKQKGRSLTRIEEPPEVEVFRAKMATEEAKAIYRRRGPVAEFSNLCLKTRNGLKEFRLRGLRKVGLEALWAGLVHNLMVWVRLCWRNRQRSECAQT